ncbi:MAG TPA: TonB-dependent receptor [Polyangia bacterium]|nr:TonB-dependent receptor [Polyangia bacterium]
MSRRRDWVPVTALAAAVLWAPAASAQDEPPGAAPGYTTVVRAGGGPPQPVSSALGSDEAARLPGTGDDPSVAAQDLPGVARPAPGATGLVLWGAAPDESRVFFDDIQIPALYHFGGFRSTVGSDLVGRIGVVPGAYGAEYGRALGGLVRVDPLALPTRGTHLALDVSFLDASASMKTSFAKHVRVAAAARASLLDETYGRFVPASATALFPIPDYADAQAIAELDVAPGSVLRATFLFSTDHVRRDLGQPVLGLPDRTQDQRARWWRAGLVYSEHGAGDNASASFFVGGDTTALTDSFGPAPSSEDSKAFEIGWRARYRTRPLPSFGLAMGLDGLITSSNLRRVGSLTVPPREGDLTVFGQPPGDDVNADAWTAAVGDVGAYVTGSFTSGRWIVAPGLRGDAFPTDGSRSLPPVGGTPLVGYAHMSWALDPRLAVTCEVSPTLSVTAAGGLYHHPADPADLSAVFGSPSLGPERSAQAALSVRKAVGEFADLDATAFYRHLDDLSVRSPLDTPALAQVLVPEGHGRAYGATLLARRQLANGTLGWLAYTVSRSQRWTDGGPPRLFDFDQTHVLTAIASHQRGRWIFGARARYATGMPRTPVAGSFLDIRDGVYQPILGPQNSTRLPAFFQLDARIDRVLLVGRVTARAYLDLQNVTDHRNPEEIVYSRDYTSSGYLTGPPLLVLIGLRIDS